MRTQIVYCVSLSVLCFSPSGVLAQVDGTISNQLVELKRKVDELTVDVANMKADVTGLAENLNGVADNVKGVADAVKSNADLIGELQLRMNDLEEDVIKKDEEIKEILEAISRKDSTTGKPTLALNHIMQESPEFRSELRNAVNSSIDKVGKVVVHNRMPTTQSLWVNRRQWMVIPPGASQELDIPVGTLTTELVGQEAPKNWTVGAPGYRQEINIEPARSVLSNRPIVSETPGYVGPRVYYSSPVLYWQ